VIDMAQLLAHVWRIGYEGPLILQSYLVGGDPYITAENAITHVRSIWERFQRRPELNPAFDR
jgi:hypothetical protein